MTYLLDVNVLIAAILDSHLLHKKADKWLTGKSLATCPIVETGFLRIVTNPKIYGVSMPNAREALRDFISKHKPKFIADDLPALKSFAKNSEAVTDFYLAHLAESHRIKLASFDKKIAHSTVEVIA
jgi:toxin-antitoxin system PIN domain toxin